MSPSAHGPLHSPQHLPKLLTDQGLKDPPGNSLHREFGEDLNPSVRCRGAATAQIISQEFRRCCLHKQAGRTGISHCWSLSTGRSGEPTSLRQHRSTPKAVTEQL